MNGKISKEIAMAFCLALALVVFMIFFINIPISPVHETTDREIKFDWIGLEDGAFVDTDQGFNDASEIRKGETVKMGPGKYYWKISETGAINSLVIQSEVSLAKQGNTVKNTGNTRILVEFFRKIGLTSRSVLDVDDSDRIEDVDGILIASEFDELNENNQTNQSQ